MNPTPQRQHVLQWLSPDVRDILFYETVDATRPNGSTSPFEIPEYGTPHPDTRRWPDHKLVFAKQADEQGQLYHFYYAVDRQEQDKYNLEFNRGLEVVRTYILPRDNDVSSDPDDVNGYGGPVEFPTTGAQFTMPEGKEWAFVDQSVKRISGPLDGLYVVVQRRWVEKKTVECRYDAELELNVKITKEIVEPLSLDPDTCPCPDSNFEIVVNPAQGGTQITVGASGQMTEVQHGNIYHDVKITQSACGEWNKELRPLQTFVNYRFPNKLKAIKLEWARAWAYSSTAAPAYDEASFFDFNILLPKAGPYPATIRRYLTEDPSSIIELYKDQLNKVPQPRRETIGWLYAWYYASAAVNKAQAVARQTEIPATIHGAIEVDIADDTLVAGENGWDETLRKRLITSSLAATPNHALLDSATDLVVDIKTRPVRLNLFMVSVVIINLTGGLYE